MKGRDARVDSAPPAPQSASADMRALLARHGVVPKRHFSQNFLLDRALCRRIAELVAPEGALAIEVGAGVGALTEPLLARCREEPESFRP